MSSFKIICDGARGNWRELKDGEQTAGLTLHYHVNSLEEDLQEKNRRNHTMVGAISPKECIQSIEIFDDGTMHLHLENTDDE